MVRCCSSYTPPAYAWALLSAITAFMCPFGLYFSNWLEREERGRFNSVSSFRLCLNETSRISVACDSYLTFGDMYSREWQAVTLMMGIGACLLVLAALMAIFGLFVRKLFSKVVVALTATVQALGVILFIVSIVVFPSGMDVSEVQNRQLCGPTADRFNLGSCELGWAFIVLIIGTVVGLVATVLSWTPLRWRDRDDNHSYSI